MAGSPEIIVQNLTYSHASSASPSLSNINITLPKGSRTLLIGANGGVHSPLVKIDGLVYQHFVLNSREINTTSNFGGEATRHIRGHASLDKGARRLSPFPARCYVPRYRMASFFED